MLASLTGAGRVVLCRTMTPMSTILLTGRRQSLLNARTARSFWHVLFALAGFLGSMQGNRNNTVLNVSKHLCTAFNPMPLGTQPNLCWDHSSWLEIVGESYGSSFRPWGGHYGAETLKNLKGSTLTAIRQQASREQCLIKPGRSLNRCCST